MKKFINAVVIALFFSLFSLMFISLREYASFLFFLILITVGGAGIFLSLTKKTYERGATIALSFLIGYVVDTFLFVLAHLLDLPSLLAIIILPATGIFLLFIRRKRLQERQGHFLQDPLLAVAFLILLAATILISDNIYTTAQGTYILDANHPLYEANIGASLTSMFPVKDSSYAGKTINYHFGYPIFANQATTLFGIDELSLVYKIVPFLSITLFLLLIFPFARKIPRYSLRIVFIIAVLFGSLSFPPRAFFGILGKITGAVLPTMNDPPFLLYRLTFMGSYAFGILLLLALFLVVRKERSVFLESIILFGLAMTKAPFFIAVSLAYVLIFIYDIYKKRSHALHLLCILLPGTIAIITFTRGAHLHNIWTIFPAWLNIRATDLSRSLLLGNALLSFLVYLVLFVGIGAAFLIPHIKEAYAKSKRSRSLHIADPFSTAIILVSFGLVLLISEVVESNSIQFIYPGYILLAILTFTHLLQKKRALPFILILLFISITVSISFTYLANAKKTYALQESTENLLTNIKIRPIRAILQDYPPLKAYAGDGCFYSLDLIAGLRALQKKEGTLLISRLSEPCENSKEISWRTGGIIRTTLSRKQAVIEHYSLKGIMMMEDYSKRSLEDVYFYVIITGTEDTLPAVHEKFSIEGTSKYEELSYYPYLKHFSTKNFFTEEYAFRAFMYDNTGTFLIADEDKLSFLHSFIEKYQVNFILFERGEMPLAAYADTLGLQPIYTSKTVAIYSTG